MRSILLALATAFAFFSVSPLTWAQEQSQKPSVSTSGEAIIYVKPDEVVLSFGVETSDASLDKAKLENDNVSVRLVKAVKEVGVEEKNLQIDNLSVELRYRGNGSPFNGIEGYVTRRSYCATLKDVKLLDKLIDAVLKSGANQLSGLEFRTTELRKHRDAARKMAIKAAKEKAQALATELEVGVGAPRTITEGASYSGYYGGRNWMSNNFAQNSIQVAPGGDGGGESQTTPLGQIAIHATVSVVFDLK